MAMIEVKVPDIGDFKDVPVIEVLVKPGDSVAGRRLARHARVGQGDDGRARRRAAGTVRKIKVKVGDKVSEGGSCWSSRPRCSGARERSTACAALRTRRTAARRRAVGRRPTPARPTSNAKCSCSAPARAATAPRSAPPTSA